ncbi:MAG: restriction endonuclease subunit S [Nitrospiraceae bacterium]|nr:restriction endonuclease subunit S [Nitrospiraceae bacterium]
MTSEITTLGKLISLQRGYDLPETRRRPGTVPVVGSAGITGYHDTAKAKGPGVTVGRSGASFGKITFIREDYWPHNAALFVTDFKDNEPLFIRYLLESLDFSSLNSGSAQQSLNRNYVYGVSVRKYDLPVQRRIAGILSAYDELIESNQRRIKILEEMARSLYREWFVHFRFPGHDKVKMVPSLLGPIPQGWEVTAIQQFGEVITGKTPSKANPDFYGQDVPFVKTPDMHGNMFILETGDRLSMAGAESQANKTIPAGSICVSCIGTIGVVSLTTEDCQTNQQINSVILAREEAREFLFIQLQDLKQKLENLGSTGATMGNVNKGKFESIEILAPPDDLLERYHRLVEPTFSVTLNLSRRIQNLRCTRDLLLPRLLSGQVLVTC